MITRIGLGLASLALAVVLVIGFRLPDDAVVPTGTTGGPSGGTQGSTSATASPGQASGSTTNAAQVVDGSLIRTRFGYVQVEITVSGGRVINITALELPVGGRSGAISQYVSPILSSEALQAQSASIDAISGATYTSRAYATSLQSALDAAGL
jgi:uncharacterized protein with FMN-binding domain